MPGFGAFTAGVTPAVRRGLEELHRRLEELHRLIRRASFGESDHYVPTWTNVTLGTGGSSEGAYTWVGGPNVGDVGLLTVQAQFVVGSSGFSIGTDPDFSLPPSFALQMSSNTVQQPLGMARLNPSASGLAHIGILGRVTDQRVLIHPLGSEDHVQAETFTSSNHEAWAAGGWVRATLMGARAVRVAS